MQAEELFCTQPKQQTEKEVITGNISNIKSSCPATSTWPGLYVLNMKITIKYLNKIGIYVVWWSIFQNNPAVVIWNQTTLPLSNNGIKRNLHKSWWDQLEQFLKLWKTVKLNQKLFKKIFWKNLKKYMYTNIYTVNVRV